MAEWYVKDLSKLTHVSVQTLHHYDRIGLLKPSVRLPNGYRLYSEKDLLKLQQIVSLKFFGFALSQIKTLLVTESDVLHHFSVQSQFLEEKAKTLLDASKALKVIVSDCKRDKSVPWETIIQLIGVYRMTEQLENKWLAQALNPEELKEYVAFEKELKSRSTESEKQAFEKQWFDLVKTIDANLDKDPNSKVGIQLGKHCLELVNRMYTKKHASLRSTVWVKGFKGGYGSNEHGLSPKSVAWLDVAMHAYCMERIHSILSKVETHSHQEVLNLWKEMMLDFYGSEQTPRNELFNNIMKDEKVSQAAKDWLEKISK